MARLCAPGVGRSDHVYEAVGPTGGPCPDCPQTLVNAADAGERSVADLITSCIEPVRLRIRPSEWGAAVGSPKRRPAGAPRSPVRTEARPNARTVAGDVTPRTANFRPVVMWGGLEPGVGGLTPELLEASANRLGPEKATIRRDERSAHPVRPDEPLG
jgi:hypothetical protein